MRWILRTICFWGILLTAAGGMVSFAKAENRFPAFANATYDMYIPIEEMLGGFQRDPEHDIGAMNFRYTIEGQLFTAPETGHIQTTAEGFQGTTDRGTPWKTLTEALAAYQRTDIDTVKALYAPATHAQIDEALADPVMKANYLAFMQSMTGIDVLLGFNHKNGFLALANVHFRDSASGATQTEIQPIFFVREGSTYLLSAQTLDEAIDKNIAIFLKNHAVADLLKLPPPKHQLTIEKQGDGEGVVVGYGIACGKDCAEFYQEGKAVFLKATPSPGSRFAGWLHDGKPLNGQMTMMQDMTITAVFDKR